MPTNLFKNKLELEETLEMKITQRLELVGTCYDKI